MFLSDTLFENEVGPNNLVIKSVSCAQNVFFFYLFAVKSSNVPSYVYPGGIRSYIRLQYP
jgi:hypothetical protein